MVKGIHRQVIVVKSPDPKLFDQAIFLLKEEVVQGEGVSAEQVLDQAQRAAKDYVRRNSPLGKMTASIPSSAWVAVGALVSSALWSLAVLL